MGTNTDPYQRAEAKYRLTRGVLEALTEHGNPFSILTKSPLVTRDLDVLTAAAAARRRLGQLLARHARRAGLAGHRARRPAPAPAHRRDGAGCPPPASAPARCRAGAARLSDRPEQLREVVAAIDGAGGRLLGIGPLHLRPGVREHFLDWLRRLRPRPARRLPAPLRDQRLRPGALPRPAVRARRASAGRPAPPSASGPGRRRPRPGPGPGRRRGRRRAPPRPARRAARGPAAPPAARRCTPICIACSSSDSTRPMP